MGTRGVIARNLEGGDDRWLGRYHHWDSYPAGLGLELVTLAQPYGPFAGDLERMLHVLIDEHPAGWSEICGADWTKAPGYYEDHAHPCDVCGRPAKDHWSDALAHTRGGNGNLALGHFFSHEAPKPAAPACYCHGDRHEQGDELIQSDGDSMGAEYAYAFTPQKRLMFVWTNHSLPGEERGWERWKLLGRVDLRDEAEAIRQLMACDLKEHQWHGHDFGDTEQRFYAKMLASAELRAVTVPSSQDASESEG